MKIQRLVNVDLLNPGGSPHAFEVRAYGFSGVRMVPRAADRVRAGYHRYRDAGLDVLLVVDASTCGDYGIDTHNADSVRAGIGRMLEDYPKPSGVQTANEPDGSEGASWRMTPAEYRLHHNAAGDALWARGVPVWTAGFSSGSVELFREYTTGISYDVAAAHPYAKTPEEARAFLRAVKEHIAPGKALAVSEWHRGESDQAGAFVQMMEDEGCIGWAFFCFSDSMVSPFGLVDRQGSEKPIGRVMRQHLTAHPAPEYLPPVAVVPEPVVPEPVIAPPAPAPAPSGQPIFAIDVSSHQGDIGPIIDRLEPDHVIVKAYIDFENQSLARFTREQIATALMRCCTVGTYVWCFRAADPAQSVQQALGIFSGAAGHDPPVLWLDCETYDDGSFRDPGPDAAWLRAAFAECDRLGVRGGLYTGIWWIDGHFPGGQEAFAEFSDHPIWVAQFDGIATIESARAPLGWDRVDIKQYSADGIDRDVCRPEVTVLAGVPEPARPVAVDLATPLAHVCDVLGDELSARRVSKARRLELVAEMRRIRRQFLGERP